ncbi:PREDICTED: CLOCK-interacting pacemaker [Nanorana parkeri]|uniref:CLOCK-interacting pacemaker n=1 Tax=Nanorana parkeri TaxID=125878 RepID=UPI000853F159|nr:PREDICTED: CLOCK-interacting pacemaker [Nanorana parkeri]
MEKKQVAGQERQQARTWRRPINPQTAPESDKDSGFSDVASECLSCVDQTDTEESSLTSRWNAPHNPPGAPPPPLLILKNLLVDQGPGPDPHSHSWTVHPSFQLLPSTSQVLVFPSSVPPAKPQPPIGKSTKYFPILDSFPKIAPHPPQGHRRAAETRRQNQTKRGLPGPPPSGERGGSSEGPVAPDCDLGPATAPNETRDGADRLAAPFSGSSQTGLSAPSQREKKSRRFRNTLGVLHRSGLLSIAIKTKELARLNQATQSQLERLQEQVSLYTTAIGSNLPEDWRRLQESLPEPSGPPEGIAM